MVMCPHLSQHGSENVQNVHILQPFLDIEQLFDSFTVSWKLSVWRLQRQQTLRMWKKLRILMRVAGHAHRILWLLDYKNHHFCTSDPITYPGSEGENKNMSARDTRQRSGKDKRRTGAGFRFQTEQDPESPALLTTRPLTGSKKSAIQASPRINQQSPVGTTPRVGGLASTDLKLDQGNPSAAMFTSSD